MNNLTLMFCVALVTVIAAAAPASALADLDIRNELIFDAAPRGPAGSLNYLGPGQAIFVEGLVKNRGNSRAPSVMVELRVNGKVIGRQSLELLRPGHQKAFSIRWVPSGEGTHVIEVIADPANMIIESDESNNLMQETREIAYHKSGEGGDFGEGSGPAPANAADLVISGDIMIWPSPRATFPSTVNVVIKNNGDATAENVEVELKVAGGRHTVRNIGNVPPEGTRTLTVQWTPPRRGTYVLVAIIDPDHKIRERDKANNRAERTVEARNR